MTEANNTFWNGRRQKDTISLMLIIRADVEFNARKNPALDAYRKFANVYYDIFNNGCSHWKRLGGTYRALCRANDVYTHDVIDLRRWVVNGTYNEELEALGDLIIDAALTEQRLDKAE